MATEEEIDNVTLTRRIDRIEQTVEQAVQTVQKLCDHVEGEHRRQRFEPMRLLTVASTVSAVLFTGGSLFLQVYVRPLETRAQTHDVQLMRSMDWMMEAQYKLGSQESRLQELAKQ